MSCRVEFWKISTVQDSVAIWHLAESAKQNFKLYAPFMQNCFDAIYFTSHKKRGMTIQSNYKVTKFI